MQKNCVIPKTVLIQYPKRTKNEQTLPLPNPSQMEMEAFKFLLNCQNWE